MTREFDQKELPAIHEDDNLAIMNSRVGISLKQRLREAVWKCQKEKQHDPSQKFESLLIRRIQPFYRETYTTTELSGLQSYILIRGKCVIEVQGNAGKDRVKNFMKEQSLPGVQITLRPNKDAVMEWFCWYDSYIFNDGGAETLSEDPHDNRNFELDEETKANLERLIINGSQNKQGVPLKDAVFKAIKEVFKNTYKEMYVNRELMPDITISDVCTIDITNRNAGFVMAFDVIQMKKYMNELLIPGALANFSDEVFTTFVWFSCKNSKLAMSIEILNEIPSDDLILSLEDDAKTKIRESVVAVHQDKDINEEKAYKNEMINRLKQFWPNTFKDKFQNGHMPDITVEGECIIEIRTRNKGIVMNKDRHAMKSSMIDLQQPAVQINFIDGNSAVILWFSVKNGTMHIDLEAQGKDMKGVSLVDFL